MTNEEMQNIIEFMIQRQETFAGNLDRLEANQARQQANLEKLQTQVEGLALIVGQIGAAQLQTQNDLSHLSKIVTLLVERNGGDSKQNP